MLKLNDLSKSKLIKLIEDYNQYIIDVCDDEQNIINKYPVCILEFLNLEFLNNEFIINKEKDN